MTCGFIELRSKENCQNSTHVKIEHHRYLPNLLKQSVKGYGCQSELPTFNYTTAVPLNIYILVKYKITE